MMAAVSISSALGARFQPLDLRQVDDPTHSNFIRRSWHDLVVVDNYLYLIGGEISQDFSGGQDRSSRRVNNTLSISLDLSWTNSSVSYKSSSSSGSAFYKVQSLWKDPLSSSFFTCGGDTGLNGRAQSNETFELYQFTADGKGGGSWSNPQPSNPSVFQTIVGSAYAASTSCAGLGLFIGSYINEYTQYKWSGSSSSLGLITYNSTSRTWANESSHPFVTYYNYGEAVCLPSYGTHGLVMFLGGSSGDSVTPTYNTNPADTNLLNFANMTFYDPVSKSWYWQAATGDIPPARIKFCAVATQSITGTTEIFVYGGSNLSGSTTGFENIYVLSIPGFQWFKGPAGTPRLGHRCEVGANRQMISVGGLTNDSDKLGGWDQVDPWYEGIGVLDMSALAWSKGFDAGAAAYESPQVVQDWYNNGHLSSVFWSNAASKALFDTGSNVTKTTPPTTPTNVGAIAGGVVGGVTVIAAVVFCWYMLQRRRTTQDRAEMPDIQLEPQWNEGQKPELDGTPVTHSELPGDPARRTEQLSGSPVYYEMPGDT